MAKINARSQTGQLNRNLQGQRQQHFPPNYITPLNHQNLLGSFHKKQTYKLHEVSLQGNLDSVMFICV